MGTSAAYGGQDHDARDDRDETAELKHARRLVENDEGEGDSEQRRQIAERAGHDWTERTIGRKCEERDRSRKHEANRGEDRHRRPYRCGIGQGERRHADEQRRRRGNGDGGAGQRRNVAQADLRQY
jgi:hypothetical protein